MLHGLEIQRRDQHRNSEQRLFFREVTTGTKTMASAKRYPFATQSAKGNVRRAWRV